MELILYFIYIFIVSFALSSANIDFIYVLMVDLFPLAIIIMAGMTKKSSIRNEVRMKEISTIENERQKELGLKIYKKCVEKGIKSLRTNADKEALSIVAYTYGVEDMDLAMNYYREGKKTASVINDINKYKQIESNRKIDLDMYNDDLKYARNYKGKNKYKKIVDEYLYDDEYEYIESSFEEIDEYINNKLYSDKNQEELFSLFDFSKISYTINDGRNFDVVITYELNKEIKILNSPGILDGTLELIVYDKDNNIVAKGLYNNETAVLFDLDNKPVVFSGFSNGTIETTCISNDYEEINKRKKYRIEIKPYYLWIMEK